MANPQVPASWAGYTPTHSTSNTSTTGWRSGVHFDEESQQQHRTTSTSTSTAFLRPEDAAQDANNSNTTALEQRDLRRRRSSLAERVHALRTAGGLNSFDNFARSWQRAAGFFEVMPVRLSFVYAGEEDEEGHEEADEDEEAGPLGYRRAEVETSPFTQRSLLREQLESGERRQGSESAFEEEEEEEEEGAGEEVRATTSSSRHASQDGGEAGERTRLLLRNRPSRSHDENIFTIEPQLASPFGGSYGTTWGSLASRVNEPSMRHAGKLFRQQQSTGVSEPDKEREPLLVKQVQEDDGKVVNVVIGQSTLPQTVFNSVNVLVGVGLLALPLSMRYAGWIPGLLFLFFAAISTSYTAKILAKCADVDSSLITFADLAYVSFGPWARIFTSIIFSIELMGACVALVVLFADSLDALIPGWGLTEWKLVCGVILTPLGFLPLRFLSYSSILGILSCLGITLAILLSGLLKPFAPGSLLEPEKTYLFPANWRTLPISFGLLMSPWGGHSVFPNIYRDMRHPYRYRSAVNITYIFTYLLDLLMAVVGYLMFGDGVKDEITRNIVLMKTGYPQWITLFIVIAIAIIPLTKVPLNARPIVSTIEISLGLDARAMPDSATLTGLSGLTRGVLKIAVRVGITILFVVLAILVPDFDRIMSLIGSVACFTICVILPCGFHLKLFGKELSYAQKCLDWGLIVACTVLALVSTAFNFVPQEMLGL